MIMTAAHAFRLVLVTSLCSFDFFRRELVNVEFSDLTNYMAELKLSQRSEEMPGLRSGLKREDDVKWPDSQLLASSVLLSNSFRVECCKTAAEQGSPSCGIAKHHFRAERLMEQHDPQRHMHVSRVDSAFALGQGLESITRRSGDLL